MRVWDCHSDLLARLLEESPEGFTGGRGAGPWRHYDLPRIERGGVGVLVCALFTRDLRGEHPVVRTLRMIDLAHRLEELSGGRVAVVHEAAALERLLAAGRTALVLSIENGLACLEHLELLRTYHRLGVRAMGLVWNGRNAIADGCGEAAAGGRLTSFGRAVVREMERLRMVIDVSHLSESCFWDLMELVRRPVIASHSNARALCEHPRNLTDEQIRAIAKSGGVIGVNFYPEFLRAPGGAGPGRASMDDVVAHVLALLERAGEDHVGIGTDFDGIPSGPEGAEDPGCFPLLCERLRAAGLSGAVLDKVLFGNFYRVFAGALG
ncbi:MAG: peptidase [Planctomycetota bacterium]|nr:MAG: peptidase [Planctomycetota bacterium]